MSVIQTIASQRKKLLDGLDANEGDINLRIFEDFYPDEAHFIYELLQNAEDAGASEVSFELLPHSCAFEHNGTRHFNEQDIRGITGIFNSSKKDSPDKIGKFGVGFKSVFVYTDSPVVYSKDYSFKILKLVLPQQVPPKQGLGERTRFELPFNNPKKDVETAYAEVKAGLEQLSETTLLFLNNLRYIKWKVGAQEGAVLREEHSESHVEVLKLVDGKEVLSSHWLRFSAPVQDVTRFSAPVDGVERQKVTVAFELELTSDTNSFDKSKPLAKQVKIISAIKGKVSVFFPAEKETSGLRFHLHGPFVPELSRASIKNSSENLPLFDQLAVVTAKALHKVKEIGLLTGEFLAVLPNNDDPLPERYQVIRKAVLEEMRKTPLVPTYGGGFAPAMRLCQARASLKALLHAEDLAFVTERRDEPDWAIGATQRNSNQDRLLASLGIPSVDTEDLKKFFESKARRSNYSWDEFELSPSVLSWLATKSFEWLQSLYELLHKHCEALGDYGSLRDVYFVKLTSGNWGTGSIAYFQTGPVSETDPYYRVDDRILTTGILKAKQQDARLFLERIGVREPNEVDEMIQLLRSRYQESTSPPSDKAYLEDLERMIALLEKNPFLKGIFAKARIFKIASLSAQWATASQVYLDSPFMRTELKIFYELTVDQKQKRWPLDSWYLSSGIPAENISRFAAQVGCQKEFDELYTIASCRNNPNWMYLSQAAGARRSGNSINHDFALTAEALLLLNSKKTEAALLVWQALRRSDTASPSILKARYQLTEKGGSRYADSQLVCVLKDLAWIPQTDGSFVKPRAATAARLPKGFAVDTGFKWLEALGFGTDDKRRTADNTIRATHRDELGFKSEEELHRALAFTKLPIEEQHRILDLASKGSPEPVELPERSVRNPELRQRRVGEEARETPDKTSVQRQRSVQLGAAEAKSAAKAYLADQYINSNGQMICQACMGELPFKLPTGEYYFEAVELVVDSPKRYRETYLALCPNHAAAYQYANAQRNSMGELVATAASNEIEVALGGYVTTLYFTEMHLADAKACLNWEESEE